MPDKEKSDIKNTVQERINNALDNEEIPRIQFNGFINSTGTGDVMIILESNGAPVAVVNGSFTVIKTLAQKLSTLIINIEKRSGNTIMTTDDVQRILEEGEDKDAH